MISKTYENTEHSRITYMEYNGEIVEEPISEYTYNEETQELDVMDYDFCHWSIPYNRIVKHI